MTIIFIAKSITKEEGGSRAKGTQPASHHRRRSQAERLRPPCLSPHRSPVLGYETEVELAALSGDNSLRATSM